jgi:PhzF family phenazine biosynthesis protein
LNVKVYTLNAFAKTSNGGNPAGVVLHADGLTEEHMQEIAAKMRLSETAFVLESKNADYKLRFFTPNKEVDLCGHATIAAFYLLASIGEIQSRLYAEETKAGVLKVQCMKDKSIFMNQVNPEFYETLDKKYIADSLNIEEELITEQLPIQIVSTGLRDVFIPINSLEALYKVQPDFDKITKISEKLNVTGYHLFSLETENKAIASCRNFAPLYDIPEEAATGTSSGALSCYLYKYGIINKDNCKNLIFEQGYSMGRPSEILAKLEISDGKIIEVKVGGTALSMEKMEINV